LKIGADFGKAFIGSNQKKEKFAQPKLYEPH
jgi:hypothetical protein